MGPSTSFEKFLGSHSARPTHTPETTAKTKISMAPLTGSAGTFVTCSGLGSEELMDTDMIVMFMYEILLSCVYVCVCVKINS